MRGLRLGILLAGTAVAAVLAAPRMPALAAADSDKALESLVPVPDTSFVPPPTATDVAPKSSQPATTGTVPAAPPTTTTATPPAPAAQPSTTTAAPTAPASQPAAANAPALSPADQQVADKLREVLTGKADRIIDHKNKPGVDAFYAARGY